jgi:hypothetical protein
MAELPKDGLRVVSALLRGQCFAITSNRAEKLLGTRVAHDNIFNMEASSVTLLGRLPIFDSALCGILRSRAARIRGTRHLQFYARFGERRRNGTI